MELQFRILLEQPGTLLVYLLLGTSILSFWVKRKYWIWSGFLTMATLLGLFVARIQWSALLFMLIYGGLSYFTFHAKKRAIQLFSGVLVFILSLLLWFHKIPGFLNWQIASNIKLSEFAVPVSLYLNFDKTLIGIFILGFGTLPLIKTKSEGLLALKQSITIMGIGILLIIFISLGVGYVKWDPKINVLFYIWAVNNLLFVSIAEEVLFRGFLQRHLSESLKRYRYGSFLALFIAALVFGLVHVGGIIYIVIATMAGILYGIVYQRTKRIEASIFAHFALNSIHYLGFTYPALASS